MLPRSLIKRRNTSIVTKMGSGWIPFQSKVQLGLHAGYEPEKNILYSKWCFA
jgi:hypothetical protein